MLTFGLASSLRQKLTVEVSDRTADQFTRPNVMYIILTRMQQFGRCYGNNSYAQCSCAVTVSLGSSVTAMPQSNIVPDLIISQFCDGLFLRPSWMTLLVDTSPGDRLLLPLPGGGVNGGITTIVTPLPESPLSTHFSHGRLCGLTLRDDHQRHCSHYQHEPCSNTHNQLERRRRAREAQHWYTTNKSKFDSGQRITLL